MRTKLKEAKMSFCMWNVCSYDLKPEVLYFSSSIIYTLTTETKCRFLQFLLAKHVEKYTHDV